MLLVEIARFEFLQLLRRVQKRHASARHDALLHGRSCGVQGVGDSVLLLRDLNLAGATDLQDGYASRQLREALLELFLLVLGGGDVDRLPQQLAPLLDGVLAAEAIENNCVLFSHSDLLCRAEQRHIYLVEGKPDLFADDLSSSEHGNILQVGLPVVAEAGRLDGTNLDATPEFVDDQRCQGLALDVLGDDQQRPVDLEDHFENGKDGLEPGHLLLVQHDERVLQLTFLGLVVRDEVGGDVTAIELHALDDLELVVQCFAVRHGDNALLADFLHSARDELPNLAITVGGDGSHLCNLLPRRNEPSTRLELLHNGVYGEVDAPPQIHGIHASSNRFAPLDIYSSSQHRGGGGTVSSHIVGFACNLANKLRTDVLELVLKLYVLGNGHSVLGDLRRSITLVQDDIATLWAQRH
mmetsp:Transcript_24962/g.43105  ORF Transcript_24962/g.43105 Transcript_24962/m.43105 type:complete len:411 (+) Transcript_24962:646-1878(+)